MIDCGLFTLSCKGFNDVKQRNEFSGFSAKQHSGKAEQTASRFHQISLGIDTIKQAVFW